MSFLKLETFHFPITTDINRVIHNSCHRPHKLSARSIIYNLFEAITLLGCYVVWVGGRLPTFRDKLSISFSKVKQSKKNNAGRLKIGPISCPEMSVTSCQFTGVNIPAGQRPQIHSGENLESYNSIFILHFRFSIYIFFF